MRHCGIAPPNQSTATTRVTQNMQRHGAHTARAAACTEGDAPVDSIAWRLSEQWLELQFRLR